ncbi:MAG: heavy-metal-associated domain-containing protein [Gemmatimonadota bacterium]
MQKVRLEITGMSCAHCLKAVDNALRGIRGTTVRDVGMGWADVEIDPSLTTVSDLIDAVGDAGYEATDAPAPNS